MSHPLISEARRRRKSRAKSLNSPSANLRSTRQHPILVDQSAAGMNSSTQPAQDNALFNQAVTKLNEAVNALPTVAVVKF